MKIWRILAGVALCSTAAMANLITNGSFEITNSGSNLPTGNGTALYDGDTSMLAWTVVAVPPPNNGAYDVAWIPSAGNGYGLTSEDGSYFLDLTGYSDQSPFSGVEQTVSLAAGQYALSFYLGVDNSNGVFAGPSSVDVSAGDQSDVLFTNSSTLPGNQWVQETLDFNVAAAGPVTIEISGDAANSRQGEQFVGLDNVDLEAVTPSSSTPEPVMAFPALLALGGLMWHQRRRKA